MKTLVPSVRLFALAAVLLALAPGRAAADPPVIFVSSANGGTPNGDVPAFSATGATATNYTTPSSFQNPQGLAYDPANNTLYVADNGTSKIRTFNVTTGAETTASTGFTSATGLSSPYGLAYSGGMLYAANSSANTVTAYNAANGAQITSFTSPTGLSHPFGLAVSGTMLYVASEQGNTITAFNLAMGTTTFTINDPNTPTAVALYGNDLFVSNLGNITVSEYDATTGNVINASFAANTSGAYGLAILGNLLLVASDETKGGVDAYGIPAMATTGNMPTSITPGFITNLNQPFFIAVVPEPSTWALLGVGIAGLGVVTLRQRRRLHAA